MTAEEDQAGVDGSVVVGTVAVHKVLLPDGSLALRCTTTGDLTLWELTGMLTAYADEFRGRMMQL